MITEQRKKTNQARKSPSKSTRMTPLAQRIAKRLNLDLKNLSGSGKEGKITFNDIYSLYNSVSGSQDLKLSKETSSSEIGHLSSGKWTKSSTSINEKSFELRPLNYFQRITAQKHNEAKNDIPHFYVSIDCNVDFLFKLKNELCCGENKEFSIDDILLLVVARVLQRYPSLNTCWSKEGIQIHRAVNLAVAVNTPDGLHTPVLRDVSSKGIKMIASEMKDLRERTFNGKLNLDELKGGTFTVSNLGLYGVKQGVVVINHPQTCILTIGAAERKAVSENGNVIHASIMNCTISCDHRVIDYSEASKFLACLKSLIEEPLLMLM